MIKKISLLIVAVCVIFACKPSLKYYEAGDGQLTVQLMNAEKEEGAGFYRVRISPATSITQQISYANKTAMIYGADSCFYMLDNSRKIYPALSQSVSNGLNGTYEYLLAFEPGQLKALKKSTFMYTDRFFTQKHYAIKITE